MSYALKSADRVKRPYTCTFSMMQFLLLGASRQAPFRTFSMVSVASGECRASFPLLDLRSKRRVIHDCHAGGGLEVEFCLFDGHILFPVAEAKFRLDVTRLANGDAN